MAKQSLQETDLRVPHLGSLMSHQRVAIKQAQIKQLRERYEKRQEWLSIAENKMRTTYCAIAKDTRELLQQIEDLQSEVRSITDTLTPEDYGQEITD